MNSGIVGHRLRTLLALILVFAMTGLVIYFAVSSEPVQTAAENQKIEAAQEAAQEQAAKQAATAPAESQYWSDPAGVGQAYGDTVPGLLTFRGNPTRTYYGEGPVPRTAPEKAWRYPATGGLCGTSNLGEGPVGVCGTGWTGQPAVFERNNKTWVVFGAYDRSVHFLNGETGEQLRKPFLTGDIIKGSVTADPDGYPLIYTGSRDNYLRVLAIDGGKVRELYKLSASAVSPVMWNNDWDGSPLIIDDYLFEGGENSQIHILKLNRDYDSQGRVTVDPELVFNAPSWDQQVLSDFGGTAMSIENSVSIYQDTMYFANSAGLVQGWSLKGLEKGKTPKRVFRFWTGDDTDASIVIDEEGFLYVASEYEKANARSREVGQLVKLDPKNKKNPLVWSVKDHHYLPGGLWGTPALHKDVLIFDTNGGDLGAVDRQTGEVLWRKKFNGPLWQSPSVVDDVLVLGDHSGDLRAYDVSDTHKEPKELWQVALGGNIESTPAIWRGSIYVGTRAGAVYALR